MNVELILKRRKENERKQCTMQSSLSQEKGPQVQEYQNITLPPLPYSKNGGGEHWGGEHANTRNLRYVIYERPLSSLVP